MHPSVVPADRFDFVCGCRVACRRVASILSVYAGSCRKVSYLVWCKKKEVCGHTGLLLSMEEDKEMRTS